MENFFKIVSIIALFFLATVGGYAQTPESPEESAVSFIASEAFRKATFDERVHMIDRHLETVDQYAAPLAWARLMKERITNLAHIGDFAAASDFVRTVEADLIEATRDTEMSVDLISSMAFIYSYAGHLEEGMRLIELVKQTDVYKSSVEAQWRLTSSIVSLYVNIGYPSLGAELLIETYEGNRDADVSPFRRFAVLSNISYVLNMAGRHDEAFTYLDELKEFIRELEASGDFTDAELTQLKWHMWSNIALAKIGMEQFEGLTAIAENLKTWGQNLQSPLLKLRAEYVEAAALFGSADYERAARMLTSAIDEARELQSLDLVAEYHTLLARAYVNLGQYREAYFALDAQREAVAELSTDQARSRSEYLNAQLNLQRKNFEIQKLEEQNQINESLRERERRNTVVLSIGAGFLALLTIGLFLSRFQLQRYAAALATREQEANAAAEAKASFLANMSHEIRTPLNGVLGMAQILGQIDLEPEARQHVSVLVDSGNTLLAIVNDVLELSKIEAGKLEIVPGATDVADLLSKTMPIWKSNAEEKGVELTCATDPEIPDVLIDAVRVRQCLSNLIGNAIKFTERGTVEISVSHRREWVTDRVVEKLLVEVSDTGIGISPERLENLFDAFEQESAHTASHYGGTGLGLAITRQLARLMNGDVTAQSVAGVGSTFTLEIHAPSVRLPTDASNTATKASRNLSEGATGSAAESSLQVLVVDDKPVNRIIARKFLEVVTPDIHEAEDGRYALDLLEAGQRYDLILLDIRMPRMDGIEFLKRLRASGGDFRDTPVIALTADAMEGDAVRYRALGADGYVPKPIVCEDLFAEIGRVLDACQQRELEAA